MIDFQTAYLLGKMKQSDYLISSKGNSSLFFPFSGINILFIETDIYAGNFYQDICENVIGFDYAECNRESNPSDEYSQKMKALGYDSSYFLELTKSCMHENCFSAIAGILPTPGVIDKQYPDYPVFNSVGLFFEETLSLRDLRTIHAISTEVVKKYNGQILSIGQFQK